MSSLTDMLEREIEIDRYFEDAQAEDEILTLSPPSNHANHEPNHINEASNQAPTNDANIQAGHMSPYAPLVGMNNQQTGMNYQTSFDTTLLGSYNYGSRPQLSTLGQQQHIMHHGVQFPATTSHFARQAYPVVQAHPAQIQTRQGQAREMQHGQLHRESNQHQMQTIHGVPNRPMPNYGAFQPSYAVLPYQQFPAGFPQGLQPHPQPAMRNTIPSLANQTQGNATQPMMNPFRQFAPSYPSVQHNQSGGSMQNGTVTGGAQAGQRVSQSEELSVTRTKKPVKQTKPKKPAKASKPKKAKEDGAEDDKKFVPFKKVPEDFTLPPYITDPALTSATACREYLAYHDPADNKNLVIENDDWEDVEKNRTEEFVGKIYGAIMEPYAKESDLYDMLDKYPKTGQKDSYHRQQQKATKDVRDLVGAVMKLKQVKACCYLMVHEVITFHRDGMYQVRYDGNEWYVRQDRKVERTWKVDLESICSERLEKVVKIIKENKRVAEDLLQRRNITRIAEDPIFYLEEKFALLRSNTTRQKNNDQNKEKAEQLEQMEELEQTEDSDDENGQKQTKGKRKKPAPRAKRSKRAAEVEAESDSEMDGEESGDDDIVESDSDVDYQPRKKRKTARS